MHPNNIYEISGSQCCQISLIVDDAVIYRNSTDHCRTFAGQLSAEWLGIAMAGQIHDGFCPHIYRTHYFLHLNIIIFAVSGYAQIYINLCTQHAADSFRIQTSMVLVCADGNFTLCYQLHQRLGRHVFFLCNCLNLRCYNSFSCCVHLCCVFSHLFSPSSGYPGFLLPTTFFLRDRRWCPQSAAMHYLSVRIWFNAPPFSSAEINTYARILPTTVETRNGTI